MKWNQTVSEKLCVVKIIFLTASALFTMEATSSFIASFPVFSSIVKILHYYSESYLLPLGVLCFVSSCPCLRIFRRAPRIPSLHPCRVTKTQWRVTLVFISTTTLQSLLLCSILALSVLKCGTQLELLSECLVSGDWWKNPVDLNLIPHWVREQHVTQWLVAGTMLLKRHFLSSMERHYTSASSWTWIQIYLQSCLVLKRCLEGNYSVL